MTTEVLNQMIEIHSGGVRSLECLIAVELKESLDKNLLEKRIRKAKGIFPETKGNPVSVTSWASLEEFTNTPLSNTQEMALAFIDDMLVLKMNHIMGDAVSMLLWLNVILTGEGREGEIKLRTFKSKKDTPYRNILNSMAWMGHLPVSSERRMERFTLEHPERIRINDILILSLLRALPNKRKSIWVPVNVREHFLEGFGNGLSRMRIYPLPKKSSTMDELSHIKMQKGLAFKNGEIALPPKNFSLDSKLKKILIKLWIKRFWADWASLSLSHIDDRNLFFKNIKSLWGVTNIIEKHRGGLFAFTQGQKTFVTFTYDKTVNKDEVNALIDKIKANFKDISHELYP